MMQNNKRILFVTIPEKGHINPMIGVAQALQKYGCNLAFFAVADISEQIKKAGLDIPVYFDKHPKSDKEAFLTRGKAFAEKIKNKEWMQQWIKTLLIDAVPEQIPVLEKVIDDFQPTLIVTDPMMYAAALVAESKKIPWAGISSSLNPITPDNWSCELTETLTLYQKEREQLFQKSAQTPHFKISDLISPWLNIVFSTEAYIPRWLSQNDFSFYVGTSFNEKNRGDEQDFPFHLLKPNCKKVYMSLGSQVYYHPHLFKAVQEALMDTEVQLIFAVNELMNTDFIHELNENVIAVTYAPQLELLPHIDLMISHGGANSVMECLAHGKPIALFPLCNDQFLQARFIQEAKVGKVLDTETPDVKTYKKQLLLLLNEDTAEVKNARIIGKSFAQHNGPEEAAQLILELAKHKKPLKPELPLEK
ncbi:putative UDP-glucosyltransferase YojK [Marivirga lumbricoides]|uniref:UDP-glucosyltransferase YojK n=1 Tax=Marivirga lumbricoides TaxID=1046115 RepID=A0ABQ1MTM5_9BACT|nr:putative UDP-glucosyltransferase YojK [Marivirga lumbricoides]